MRDLIGEATTLGILLEETRGVVGVVLGTPDGAVRSVVGSFVDGAATAAGQHRARQGAPGAGQPRPRDKQRRGVARDNQQQI